MKFDWKSDYNIGSPVVDDEHKELFRQVGTISDLLADDYEDEEKLDGAIDQLVEYAKAHFEDEERLMLEAGVDDRHVSKQRMEHRSFVYDLEKIRGISVDEELAARFERLLSFAANWLVFHTLQTDQQLGIQLSALRDGKSAEEAYAEAQTASFGPAINRPVVAALVHLWSGAMGTVHVLESQVAKLKAEERP